MNAHDLARKLLEGPNLPVYTWSEDASQYAPVTEAEVNTLTGSESAEDADGEPMPETFVYLTFTRL